MQKVFGSVNDQVILLEQKLKQKTFRYGPVTNYDDVPIMTWPILLTKTSFDIISAISEGLMSDGSLLVIMYRISTGRPEVEALVYHQIAQEVFSLKPWSC